MAARKPLLAAGLLGVAVLAAGLVWRAYDRDMATARQGLAGRSTVIASPYGPIEYAEAGAGPPALVVHGSGGGFDQGLAFSRRLQAAGFRVIAPSRFGYLRSAYPPDASPELQADALAYLLRRLGTERAVIFGGSAGALSASQLALRHPQMCQGLVLLVPALYAPDRAVNESAAPNAVVSRTVEAFLGSDFLFWAAVRTAPTFLTRMILATDPALVAAASETERRRVRAALGGILPVSARRRGLLMDSATAGAPQPYPFATLTCPMLAISTRDDLYGTGKAAAYAAGLAPDARLILYDTGGHMWVGHDEDVWSKIAAFARARSTAGPIGAPAKP